MTDRRLDVVLDYAEVKMDHLAMLDGTLGVNLNGQSSYYTEQLAEWRRNPAARADWWGGSADDTRRWIREGYSSGTSAVMAPPQVAPRKHTKWREEGDELSLERAWSGDPTPFSSRESGTKAGIRIEAGFNFNVEVDNRVIEQYGQWLAQLTAGYAAAGHDLEISIVSDASGLLVSGPSRVRHLIQVKRFGQQSDYSAWSSLFAPTGFRHIMFGVYCIDAARRGYRVETGLGRAYDTNSSWGVKYDEATSTISVSPNFFARDFPADRMTELAKAAFKP